MGVLSILVLVVFVSTVVSAVWRINLVLNHPEKAERLREYEQQRKEDRREVYRRAAPVISAGAKFLVRMLTSRGGTQGTPGEDQSPAGGLPAGQKSLPD
jgi:hypothetical protein